MNAASTQPRALCGREAGWFARDAAEFPHPQGEAAGPGHDTSTPAQGQPSPLPEPAGVREGVNWEQVTGGEAAVSFLITHAER